MVHHPHYLELPWDIHWRPAARHRLHLWWLMTLLVLLAIFMIGVGDTTELMQMGAAGP
jgi:hypothetical protein